MLLFPVHVGSCTVDGGNDTMMAGNGTVQGTCEAGELCNSDGICYPSTYTYIYTQPPIQPI